MGDFVVFEDGRLCSLGTSPLCWVLEDVSARVSPEFAIWLRDVARRPCGLASFDLRGLEPDYRQQFYVSLQNAFAQLLSIPEKKQYLDQSRYLMAFRSLLRTYKRSRRRLSPVDDDDKPRVPWDGRLIDISALWFCPNCNVYLGEKAQCDACGWGRTT